MKTRARRLPRPMFLGLHGRQYAVHGMTLMMKVKENHIPLRTCIGCRMKRPAREMLRFGVAVEEVVVSGVRYKTQGRGCYACPEETCVKNALKKGRIERALRKQLLLIPSPEDVMRGFRQKGRSDDYDDR